MFDSRQSIICRVEDGNLQMTHPNSSFLSTIVRLGSVTLLVMIGALPAPLDCYARPATLGLQLPFPIQTVAPGSADSLGAKPGIELLRFWLTIDTAGAVANVAPTTAIGSDQLQQIQRFFTRFHFEPGRRHDSALSCRVIVELSLSTDSAFSRVRFPVSSDTQVSVQDLYLTSLGGNSVQVAAWKRFPWFHATVSSVDTTPIPRFALIRVDLGVKGGLTRKELVATNYPGFGGQLVNAAGWAGYQPAKVGGKPVASSNFLLVTFYPSISYPTKPLLAAKPDSSTWHRKYLLRMLPDSSGYMSEPIPRAPSTGSLQIPVSPKQSRKSFIFECEVDSSGVVHLKSPLADTTGVPTLGAAVAKSLRFYPALDFAGRPKSFEGYAEVSTLNRTNVRIRFLWLR